MAKVAVYGAAVGCQVNNRDSKAPAPADMELGARKEASTGRPSAMLPPEATCRDPCDQKEPEQEWGGQLITQDKQQEITNIHGRISTASSAYVQIWVDKNCAFSREKNTSDVGSR